MYECIKDFSIEVVDDNGCFTEEYKIIEKGSFWCIDEDESNNMLGAEIRLIKCFDDDNRIEWIEISKETLLKHFYDSRSKICRGCFFFHGSELTEMGFCSKYDSDFHENSYMNNNCFLDKKEGEKLSKEVIDNLFKEASIEVNKYIIRFDTEDSIEISIKQDINRPNNPEDFELIEKYIKDNYGNVSYEIIDLDTIKRVSL